MTIPKHGSPDSTRPIDAVLARLAGARKAGDGRNYTARCPAHDDRLASLSISEDREGKVLLNCFAGCGVEEVVAALGLSMADLFPRDSRDERPGGSDHPDRRPAQRITVDELARDKGLPTEFLKAIGVEQGLGGVKISYRLQDGTPAPRQRWRRALSAKEGSSWLKGDGPPAPYGLWMLDKMRAVSDTLTLVEGESDSWTLWHYHIPALGIPGADMAKTLELAHVEPFARLLVFQEPDKGGETFVAGVTARLARIGYQGEVSIIRSASHKDPNELHKHLKASAGSSSGPVGASAFLDAWSRLVSEAEPLDLSHVEAEVKHSTVVLALPEAENLTDLGNARRLVRHHARDLRYCHPWDKWLIWDGRRWTPDTTGNIVRRAKDTVAALYREAAEIEDLKERQRLVAHALRSESDSRLRAMIRLAESEPGIPVLPDDFDADPWSLNVQNGTLDLRTGELRPHSRDDLMTKVVAAEYREDASCPLWTAFLERIMGGNEALIAYLQRVVGYALTGDTREQCLFMLYGTGANGKSTFLETLRALFGDYGQQADFSTFLYSKDDRVRNDIARLMGRRFVAAIEADAGRYLAEVLVKQLTGSDTIAARFLFKELFEFHPTFKIFLAANHRPSIRGQDHAIWRRIRLIPFEVTIPAEERDRDLLAKLRTELPGILAWAVHGCMEWQHRSLAEPSPVLRATDEYRQDMDVLAAFLDERCVASPGARGTSKALYDAYCAWCQDNAEDPVSARVFGLRLKDKGFRQGRTERSRHWIGIGLTGQYQQAAVGDEARSLSEPEIMSGTMFEAATVQDKEPF